MQTKLSRLIHYLQSKLFGHQSKNITINFFWLIADRVFRLGIGLFVGVWVARYLGAENFGTLNYALAISAIITSIASLGLDEVIIKHLVQNKESESELLGTSFLLRLLASTFITLATLITLFIVKDYSQENYHILIIICLSSVFSSVNVIDFYFQSHLLAKQTVIASNIAFILSSIIKILLIIFEYNVIAFTLVILFEAIFITFSLFYFGMKNGLKYKNWKFKLKISQQLLKESWPLVLSGLAVILYMRIDQLMIGEMLNTKEVGIYSAAVKISELWYFIPMALASSVFPSIIRMRNQDMKIYYMNLQRLYSLMIWLAIIIALPISIFSKEVIFLIYGNEYAGAETALIYNIWAGIFVAFGVARGKWILAESYQKYTFYYIFAGLITNVALNFILIPVLGISGAALSTLISQAMVAVIAPFFIKQTRISSIMFVKGLFLKGLKND